MSKNIRNTLEGFTPKPGRCQGNTTRQVDLAIQILFEDGVVKCLDHWEEGSGGRTNEWLFDRVIKRLQTEHRSEFRADKKDLIISLN